MLNIPNLKRIEIFDNAHLFGTFTVSGMVVFTNGKPDKKEFQKIVTTLADRYGVEMEEEKLLLEANKWELSHGGLSGRTAQQFIDYLLGQQ